MSRCRDCRGGAEYYMVHPAVWLRVMPDWRGILCLKCLSARLGRPLHGSDFAITPGEMQRRRAMNAVELDEANRQYRLPV